MVISFYANKLWWDTADFASLPVNLPDGYNGQDRETGDGYYFSVSRLGWILLGVSSTFVPTDVANIFAWWDFSDSDSVTRDGSNRISAVTDLSINGRNLVQNTAGGQPLYVFGDQNGLNVCNYDSAARRMRATLGTVSQPISYFMTVRIPAGDANNHTVCDSGNAQASFNQTPNNTISGTQINAGTDLASSGELVNQWVQITTKWNTTSSSFSYNGVEIASGNAGSNALQDYTQGSHRNDVNPWLSTVGEFIMYDALVSNDDTLLLENYLKTKWGTP